MRTTLVILIGIALISVMVTPAMAADFWQSDSNITLGLEDYSRRQVSTVFNMDGAWYLISGAGRGTFLGFEWNGSAWQSDPAIVSGLEDYGYPNGIERDSEPEVFYKDGTWYLIASMEYFEYPYPHGFIGFYWNSKRSKWLPDSDIVAGLPERTVETSLREPTVFNKDGTWYLISGAGRETFLGFAWNGSAWQSDSAIVSGLGVIRTSAPTVFNKDGTWYLISGEYFGRFYGYKWTGSAWESDPAIVSGLGSIGYYSRPDVFNMDEAWYLLSGERYETFYGWHQVKTPDLTTTAINAPQLIVNQPSSITATIANVGDADASAFNVSLSANGVVVDTVNVPSLGVENSTGVSFEWTPTSVADQELCVVADSNDAIDEVYEANNKECITVTVNAPDLTPTAINVPALFVNLTSTVTATIDNVGTFDATSFNVSLSADGSVVDTANVLSLSAGESTTVSFKWTLASAGDHKLCVVADYDGTIVELDETNNETCIPVTVSEISEDIVWYYGTFMPFDAERLSNNNTLITEFGNHRVMEVTPAGEIVWQYGTTGVSGSGANQLDTPIDAERVSNSNTTLITDSINNRVIAVNLSGAIVWQYGNGTAGNGVNQLDKPRDAKPLENGNTLIVDRHNERVIEVRTSDYDPTKQNNGFTAGSIVWQYGTTGVVGSGPNELNLPVDTERLGNGNTLIADFRNHRVIEVRTSDYDPMKQNNGFTLDSIVWQYGTTGTDGSGVNQLNHPEDARRLESGNTLIADYENHRVIEVRTSDYNPAKSNNGFTTRSIVWEYGSNNPADAERLENGNTLITEHANNRIIEVITPPPAKLKPVTPFLLFGEVEYDTGEPVRNLTVTVKNVDTTEEFDVEIYVNVSENRSFYQLLTVSGHVLAGDVLYFVASNDNTTEFPYTVTEEDMNYGGFMQNITIVRPIVPMPDLAITAINAYHNDTRCPAWFNLSNEVDVTVKNIGTLPANESSVCLYIDGEFWKMSVPGLDAGASETVTFENWKPIGDDCLKTIDNVCQFEWSYKDYNIRAVADCDNAVNEGDETNNEITVVDRACYNGYMADEPLENIAHGMLKGHLLYTTGDGMYTPLYNNGDTQVTNYDITIPDTATVKLAHLNVYYTWTPDRACPEMEVRIDGTAVPLEKAYNDMKCTCPGASWNRAWGNYVYNISDYITANGTYTVTVKNVMSTGYFCPAAPGIVLVYEDANAPQIEYWINEGADILMGGRRYPTSSNLAWWENINNATFTASTETSNATHATLGVVSPWGGSSWHPGSTNYLLFNDAKLGTGVYHGYSEKYKETIDSITMDVGRCPDGMQPNAQIGVNVTSVTDMYLKGSDNVVGQCDDGDNMMPSGAFLVVEYGEEAPPKPDLTVTEKNETLLDGNFTVNYTVRNIGSVEAGASTTTITTSDGQSVEDSSVSALAAGASYTNTVGPFDCTCNQTLNVTVCADSDDVVDESEEGNNCLENELVCPVCTELIEAGVTFSPNKLDLNSSGVLKAYITLPEGYNATVEYINVSKVACEGEPVFGFGKVIPGKQALEVKFKIHNLTVPTGDAVLLTVTGELYDGTPFEGSNTVEVV